VEPALQDVRLRPMVAADIEHAVALTRAEGWPHRAEDWEFHLSLGAGWVLESAEGELLGTLLWWAFGDNVATLGLIVVDRRCQGRGLGSRLMKHALQQIRSRTLRLVATAAGYTLYQRSGFEPVAAIEQRQSELTGVEALPAATGEVLRPATRGDLDTLCRMDRDATGAERRQLLSAVLDAGKALVLESSGHCVGFAMLRPAGRGHVVGPVVAEDQAEASLLVSHLLAGFSGFCRIDVPRRAGALAAWLDRIGLPVVDQVTAMQNRPPVMARTSKLHSYALVSHAFG